MAFWHSKDFKILYTIWEEKLRSEEFPDAEEGGLDSRVLKQRASNVYRAAPEVTREAKRDYFELLAEHVGQHVFRSDTDRIILFLRSQGHKLCEIALHLEGLGLHRHPKTIRFVIRRYETAWGIRKWLPNQMISNPKKP